MSNKTKEQLKDIKLFADFIDIKLIQEWEDCTDTKTSIHIGWIVELSTDLVLGRFVYKTFNPEEDWNLLHKAYNKARIIAIENRKGDNLKWMVMIMETALKLNANVSLYEDILSFIKYYNQINTNTNNNQS